MSKVAKVFEFDGLTVRTDIGDDGEPLFCASDVARCLGYSNSRKAIGDHCNGVTNRYVTDSMGRKQRANFIPESDLYQLVMASRLSGAQRFKAWVCGEVLPSIRKTGQYSKEQSEIPPVPQSFSEALLLAGKIQQEKEQLELEAKTNQPFTVAGKALLHAHAECKIGGFAKAIEIDGRRIGPNQRFRFLREKGVLYLSDGRNLPCQRHMDAGRFSVRQNWRPDGDCGGDNYFTTYVTPKGEGYIINLLRNDPDFLERTTPVRGGAVVGF